MSKARDIADLDFNNPDIDGGNIDGATIGGTTPAAGSFTGVNISGGSQLGQDYAYFKSNSTSNASLTLRKDSSGADAIDFLQLRNNGNGLIGKIEGDGDISFGAATFTGGINSTGLISNGDIQINGSGSEDRALVFGLDGKNSPYTSANASYIFSGQGGSGDYLAGGLYLQSRSSISREIGFITGSSPAKRMAIYDTGVTINGTLGTGAITATTGTDQAFPLTIRNTDTDSSTYIKYQDWAGQYWTSGINYANNDFYFTYQGALSARFLNAGGLDTYGNGEFGVGAANANNYHVKVRAGTTGLSRVIMSDTTDAGYVDYNHNGDYFSFKTSGAEALNIFTGGDVTATGNLSSSGGAAKVGGTSTVFTNSSFTITTAAQTVVPLSAVSSLPAGTYLMTISLSGGNWYSSTVTGIVQHYNGTTNSNSSGGPNTIHLTSAGHAQNSGDLFARNQTTVGNTSNNGVQIWGTTSTTTSINIQWKRLA